MRDKDGRASFHDLAQMVEDAVFGLRVHAGEGVVKHQDSRIADYRSRDGGALLLAAGKRQSALADQRVVAVGEALDLSGNAGCLGGAAYFVIRGVVRAEGNVLADGVAEQKRLLRDEPNAAA